MKPGRRWCPGRWQARPTAQWRCYPRPARARRWVHPPRPGRRARAGGAGELAGPGELGTAAGEVESAVGACPEPVSVETSSAVLFMFWPHSANGITMPAQIPANLAFMFPF